MAIFKCKMCGGDLEISEGMSVCQCEYCGTNQTIPKLDNEKKLNLYDRAGHFRRNNEFDKAIGVYEKILEEDNTDSEAYWSLVLCKYGIEYVEDPSTHKRILTVNRAQYTSVFMDEDYKSAIEYADSVQKSVYESEAKAIDEIQKGILEISQKEEPFDVFICYKETDNNGRRTPDSVLANDLYHQLVQENFKVFFARITLEDKLGSAYEPYIFAALNSAKVMVVLGTKPEYFNAVWVKNEWSRYLALIKNGAKKILIPAYRDMDPYDLPEEFSHLQAQDMSKLGFMQDLIRGIKKLTAESEPKTEIKETVIVNNGANANTAPLLKRAFMFLEDSDWGSADEYCEKVLDIDPECAEAYLGKLLAKSKAHNIDELNKSDHNGMFKKSSNYEKAYRFGDDALKEQLTNCYNQSRYAYADNLFNAAANDTDYRKAKEHFENIGSYSDAAEKAKECEQKALGYLYDVALNAMDSAKNDTDYRIAQKQFEDIKEFRDAAEKAEECEQKALEYLYNIALNAMNSAKNDADFRYIQKCFERISGFRDAAQKAEEYEKKALEYIYTNALTATETGNYASAIELFRRIPQYKDSKEKLIQLESKQEQQRMLALEKMKAKEKYNKLENLLPMIIAFGIIAVVVLVLAILAIIK